MRWLPRAGRAGNPQRARSCTTSPPTIWRFSIIPIALACVAVAGCGEGDDGPQPVVTEAEPVGDCVSEHIGTPVPCSANGAIPEATYEDGPDSGTERPDRSLRSQPDRREPPTPEYEYEPDLDSPDPPSAPIPRLGPPPDFAPPPDEYDEEQQQEPEEQEPDPYEEYLDRQECLEEAEFFDRPTWRCWS